MRPLTRQGERLYNFWVLVKPAEDVPGQWLAHCLEVDVVTQGDSIKHVLDMISEAVPMVVEEDLSTGRDPHERRAPKEYWNELYQLLNDSEPTDLARVMEHDPSSLSLVAAQLVVSAWLQPKEEPKREIPAIWSRRNSRAPAIHV